MISCDRIQLADTRCLFGRTFKSANIEMKEEREKPMKRD